MFWDDINPTRSLKTLIRPRNGSGIISTESTAPDKKNQNIDTLVGDDEDRNVASLFG